MTCPFLAQLASTTCAVIFSRILAPITHLSPISPFIHRTPRLAKPPCTVPTSFRFNVFCFKLKTFNRSFPLQTPPLSIQVFTSTVYRTRSSTTSSMPANTQSPSPNHCRYSLFVELPVLCASNLKILSSLHLSPHHTSPLSVSYERLNTSCCLSLQNLDMRDAALPFLRAPAWARHCMAPLHNYATRFNQPNQQCLLVHVHTIVHIT